MEFISFTSLIYAFDKSFFKDSFLLHSFYFNFSSIKLYRTGSTGVNGIMSHTYIGTERTFDNGQILSENKCFCNRECAKSGARDVSTCRIAPLFFSFPHFYMADNSYRDSISGMKPNKSEHEFFISLDPVRHPPIARDSFPVNLKPPST